MKTCSKCKTEQLLTEFHKSSRHTDGLNPQCKTCFNTKRRESNSKNKDVVSNRSKEWYLKNKDAVRISQMLVKYGITNDQYKRMLNEQNGCCAICNSIMNGPREPAIDHCHTTGAVRGLLCSSCNVALGHMKDDIVRLEKAIVYLKNSTKLRLVG